MKNKLVGEIRGRRVSRGYSFARTFSWIVPRLLLIFCQCKKKSIQILIFPVFFCFYSNEVFVSFEQLKKWWPQVFLIPPRSTAAKSRDSCKPTPASCTSGWTGRTAQDSDDRRSAHTPWTLCQRSTRAHDRRCCQKRWTENQGWRRLRWRFLCCFGSLEAGFAWDFEWLEGALSEGVSILHPRA